MGISDDIKPKKVFHYKKQVEHPIYTPPPTKEELSKPEEIIVHEEPAKISEEKEKLQDEFFKDYQYHPSKVKAGELKPKKTKPLKRIFIILIAVALLSIVVYQNIDPIKSYFFHQKNKKDNSASTSSNDFYTAESSSTSAGNTTTTENPTTTESETSDKSSTTPVAQPDKSKISLEVLNGNGIAGSADKVKSTLTSAGFTVSRVTNAKKFTYQSTYIYFKTGKDSEAALVKDALSGRENITEKSDSLAGDYDIVVVVGKK